MAFLRPALLVLLFALSVSAGRPEGPPKKEAIKYLVQGGGRIDDGVIIKVVEIAPLRRQRTPYTIPERFAPIVKELVVRAKFSVLIDIITNYIDTAALFALIEKAGPLTLFAPTDDAFAKIPVEVLEGLKARPEILLKLIAYHFVRGAFPSKEILLRPKFSLKSILEVDIIEVTVEKEVVLIGVSKVLAKVTEVDVIIIPEKFVVHAIDFVLVPSKFVIYAAKKAIAANNYSGN